MILDSFPSCCLGGYARLGNVVRLKPFGFLSAKGQWSGVENNTTGSHIYYIETCFKRLLETVHTITELNCVD